jgi:hypothetical protein
MATIKTLSIVPDTKHTGSGFIVTLEVRTSTGRYDFPFTVEDQGSPAANEQQARSELLTFLQEALQALQS